MGNALSPNQLMHIYRCANYFEKILLPDVQAL